MREQLSGLRPDDAQRILDELGGRMLSSTVNDPLRYCSALISRLRRGRFKAEAGGQIASARARERAQNHVAVSVAHSPPPAVNAKLDELPERMRRSLERLRQNVTGVPPRAAANAPDTDEPDESP